MTKRKFLTLLVGINVGIVFLIGAIALGLWQIAQQPSRLTPQAGGGDGETQLVIGEISNLPEVNFISDQGSEALVFTVSNSAAVPQFVFSKVGNAPAEAQLALARGGFVYLFAQDSRTGVYLWKDGSKSEIYSNAAEAISLVNWRNADTIVVLLKVASDQYQLWQVSAGALPQLLAAFSSASEVYFAGSDAHTLYIRDQSWSSCFNYQDASSLSVIPCSTQVSQLRQISGWEVDTVYVLDTTVSSPLSDPVSTPVDTVEELTRVGQDLSYRAQSGETIELLLGNSTRALADIHNDEDDKRYLVNLATTGELKETTVPYTTAMRYLGKDPRRNQVYLNLLSGGTGQQSSTLYAYSLDDGSLGQVAVPLCNSGHSCQISALFAD